MKLIGMIHLLPLPGTPGYGGSFEAVIDRALGDIETLIAAGFNGLLVENYGDLPFFKETVPPHTVASMTAVARAIRERTTLPLGVQVLRNDAFASLAVAAATGADFIRVNVLAGAMLTDQGIIEGKAAELLRYRAMLAPGVKIWADVHVKHAHPLAEESLTDAARDLESRARADAIIVSGRGTGEETPLDRVMEVRSAVRLPLVIGSGITEGNAMGYIPIADYAIVGTAIKKGGRTENAVDGTRAQRLADRCK
jgi:hypothetical protein